jgi:hypothetical protein
MAKYNEILVGRYNRFMQKLLSMKGPACLSQLAGELQPSLPFFNGVENRYLEAWNRFAAAMQLAAGAAGNKSSVLFRNPVGSNVIAVFEKILDANNGAAAQLNAMILAPSTVDLATLQSTAIGRLDARAGSTAGSSLILSKTNVAPAIIGANAQWIWNVAVSQNLDLVVFEDQEVTLLPGDALQIFTVAAAVPLTDSFVWRERLLEDSERA